MLAAVVTVSFLVGSNAVKSLLDTIPEFIKHGLSVATGIIPALGFAMLARLLDRIEQGFHRVAAHQE